MEFKRGFLLVVAATWLCALLSFLSPSVVLTVGNLLGVSRPGTGWLFVPLLLWMCLCAAGLATYRGIARWLLVSAPMAFFTPLLTAATVFGCVTHLVCG
jgi:hypothetical protein